MVPVLAAAAVLSLGVGVAGVLPERDDDAKVVFTFADRQIQESSGLVARGGLFATVNDSGDVPRVFTVDPANGRTVGVTRWPGEVRDVEALAPVGGADETGAGELWVGDTGDNLANRPTVTVHRVPWGRGDVEADGDAVSSYELDYPDGPHDTETMLAHPVTGRLYLVSKEVGGGRVYAAPEALSANGPNRMQGLNGEVMPVATDGAFFPDGEHVLMRGYSRAYVYTFPELEEVARLDLPFQQQGEGVAIDEDNRVYLSTEGDRTDVLELPLPKKLRAVVVGEPPEPEPESAPEPEEDKPLWPYLFMGGMGAVVVVGVVRLFFGGRREE